MVQEVFISMKSFPEQCYATAATQPRFTEYGLVIPRSSGGQLSKDTEVKHEKNTHIWVQRELSHSIARYKSFPLES